MTPTSDPRALRRDTLVDTVDHVIQHSVELDGLRRTFTVIGAPTAPAARPLVLAFHGSRQDGESHRRFTHDALLPLATSGEAVVAYLDGYRGHWNDARRESSFAARRRGVDDVAFAQMVVDRLEASHGIDPARVVTVGYSNGGQMVFRLLHEAPELVSAAVIIAAAMPAPESFLASPSAPAARPIPIALVHGTRDPIVPFEGGTMRWWARRLFRVGGRSLSAPETAAYLAARNGLDGPPEVTPLEAAASSDGRTTVIRTRYSTPDIPSVTLYEVRGGGHTVPGLRPSPRMVGRTTADVTLADLVAEAVSLA